MNNQETKKKKTEKIKKQEYPKNEFVTCECGHEQADMGGNVACEDCGQLMPTNL